MSEEIKSEFRVLLVGRSAGAEGSSVALMLERLGVSVAACGTVYTAMAMLSTDAAIQVVIVRLAELGRADHAFFRAVERFERRVLVYVDASGAEGEDIERAVSMGAAGVIDADSRGEAVVSGWVGRVARSNGHGHDAVDEERLSTVRVPWKPLPAIDQPVRIGPGSMSEDVGLEVESEKSSEPILADEETNVMLKSGDDGLGGEKVSGLDDGGAGLLLSREEIDSLIYGSSGMDEELGDREGLSS